jgi:hypothetical protein
VFIRNYSPPAWNRPDLPPLIVLDCARCGMTMYLPEPEQKRYWTSGEAFYCPKGHWNSYGRHKP